MKIGLYGGSFNPVHNGHIEVMNKVLQKGVVDEIWVVPCKNHAFDKDLLPLEHRVEMLKEAIKGMNGEGVDRVRIDYTEALLTGKSYTSRTLKKLRKENPEKTLYFVLGTDALNDLDKWHNSAYIRKTTPFILIKRKGYDLKNYGAKNDSHVMLEDVIEEASNISSTDIRERLACREPITGMVPEGVERYILKNGLYKNTMSYENAASTVDLIVKIDGGILFVKRKHAPFKGQWAFPGGYLECEKETLEEAGVRELSEETSLIAKPKDLELLGIYSDPGRDPRGHVISHAYVVKKFKGKMHANDDAAEVHVFKDKPEKLAFDHSKIYDDYKKRYG